MRNFLQFMIPLLIIAVIGFIMMYGSTPINDHKKLYIKCNNGSSKSYTIDSITEIDFEPNDEKCNLKVSLMDVGSEYVQIKTPYLWGLNFDDEIDEAEGLKESHIVEVEDELILYSMDKQTKFSFKYK